MITETTFIGGKPGLFLTKALMGRSMDTFSIARGKYRGVYRGGGYLYLFIFGLNTGILGRPEAILAGVLVNLAAFWAFSSSGIWSRIQWQGESDSLEVVSGEEGVEYLLKVSGALLGA